MELHQLRYFLAIAEVGSFSKAARLCHIAQPSLSQQIKKLERELGTPLFDRLGRSIALTEAGNSLLPRARRVIEEVRDIEEHLADDPVEGKGSLSIGAIPTMTPYVIPRVTQKFLRRYEHVNLTFREHFTESLVKALVDGELDAALLSTPIKHDAIEVEVLYRERFLLAVPADHPLARRRKVPTASLKETPTILLSELHCLGRQTQEFCNLMKMAQSITCLTAQLLTVQELVARGLGVSLVPEMAAATDKKKVRVYIPLADGDPGRDVAIARRKGRSRSALVEQFVDLLRKPVVVG